MKRVLFLFFLLILFGLNGWILINRNNGFKYYPYKTYRQLYTTDSTQCFTDIEISQHTIVLRFSLPLQEDSRKLYIDDSFSTDVKADFKSLSFTLKNGFHKYTLVSADSLGSLPVSIAIDHTQHGNNNFDNEIISSNVPGPGIESIPLSTYQISQGTFSERDAKEGLRLLNDSVHISGNDDEVTKVFKIGMYLQHLPNNTSGTDPVQVALTNPIEQIKSAQQNKANLNCGNYAAMFYFLSGLAGLVTRGITYTGPDGNWHYGSHFMNEVYLHNFQQWALVDNLNNIYLLHDSTRFYNAADVKKMSEVDGFVGKFFYDLSGDLEKKKSYADKSNLHYYYNQTDADISYSQNKTYSYSLFNNLWQFYLPIRRHDLYSDKRSNNIGKLFFKTIAIVALLMGLILYCVWEIKHKRSTASKHKK